MTFETAEDAKYAENLQKALTHILNADHMLYVTYPLIKDKKLLIGALNQIYSAIGGLLKCSSKENLTQEEQNTVKEIFAVAENHKNSPMIFSRREKVVMMSDNLGITTLDAEKLKNYLNLAKNMAEKTKLL